MCCSYIQWSVVIAESDCSTHRCIVDLVVDIRVDAECMLVILDTDLIECNFRVFYFVRTS